MSVCLPFLLLPLRVKSHLDGDLPDAQVWLRHRRLSRQGSHPGLHGQIWGEGECSALPNTHPSPLSLPRTPRKALHVCTQAHCFTYTKPHISKPCLNSPKHLLADFWGQYLYGRESQAIGAPAAKFLPRAQAPDRSVPSSWLGLLGREGTRPAPAPPQPRFLPAPSSKNAERMSQPSNGLLAK